MANSSNLIVKHYAGWGGSFVDSIYLGKAYETGKPELLFNFMMKLYSSNTNIFTSKPLLSMVDDKSITKKEISTDVFTWKMYGADQKFARSLENLESSNPNIGLNGATFRIKIDQDYYKKPEVLLGTSPEFPLEIVDGPFPDGKGFIYIVKIQGDNVTTAFPKEHLEAGKEFSKAWTSVQNEYNSLRGGQQYGGHFMLQSQIGAFGQELTVTDKAWRENGRLNIFANYKDRNGVEKSMNMFLPMAEAKMEDELYKSIEMACWLGKKSTSQTTDGYMKRTGPGIHEQLKDSWVDVYSTALTTQRLQDFTESILVTRSDEMNRKLTGVTGTMGQTAFHKAMASDAKSLLTLDTNFVKKDANGLVLGNQFRRYIGLNGVEIDLKHNPFYDSRVADKRNHPANVRLPIMSQRITFLDLSNNRDQMTSNVVFLTEKDTYRSGVMTGTHTPSGPVKGGNLTTTVAGYTKITEGTGGVVVLDVSRCGELIFDVE